MVESWVWPHQNQAFIANENANGNEYDNGKGKGKRQRQKDMITATAMKMVSRILLVILRHCEKGSPEYPLLQTQIGMWFLTLQ